MGRKTGRTDRARAKRGAAADGDSYVVSAGMSLVEAAEVIRRRRSAVAFDYRGRMDRPVFFDLLARTLDELSRLGDGQLFA